MLNQQPGKATRQSTSLWKTAQPATCKGCLAFRFTVENCSTGDVQRLLGIPLQCGKLFNQQRAKGAWHSALLMKIAQPAMWKDSLALRFTAENDPATWKGSWHSASLRKTAQPRNVERRRGICNQLVEKSNASYIGRSGQVRKLTNGYSYRKKTTTTTKDKQSPWVCPR